MRQIAYKVLGLDCAEEIAVLRREVGNKSGVTDLDFDLLNGKMTVRYDPATISQKDIVGAIEATGMEPLLWGQRTTGQPATYWQRCGRPIMTFLGGVSLVGGFLSHGLLHHSLIDALTAGDGNEQHVFPWVSMALYLGSIILSAWFVFPKAISSARRFRPDMNLLMIIAVIGAIAIGEWFEAAMVTFLFALALLLEQRSVGRARRAIAALMDLSPATARLILPETGEIVEKSIAEVAIGATVLIRPGEKIPLDGVVLNGASTVNQAPITGESKPVSKNPGHDVFAGTINEDGALEIEVTKAANDTTLARIVHMIEAARSRRSVSEQWVEKFALYYTPAMLALAVGIAVFPPFVLGAGWSDWLYRGLVILVIACPCALVISTPVSIVSGLTAAARNGVLIKGGTYLEAASRLKVVCLDKTGTLTYGHPEVQEIIPLNDHTSQEVLEIAASLEAQSEHPLARAILRKAEADGAAFCPADGFKAVKGKGAEARIDGRSFWIGSHRLMHEKGQETGEIHRRAGVLEDAGHSVVAIGNDQHVCGLITVADGIRRNAAESVQALKRVGVRRVVMLTGDNIGSAEAVANVAGIDEFQAELLPQDKVRAVESLVRELGQVAMVGDGVNDAPAMAAATFGVAMGAMGTDVAIETADIALMSDDLSRLPWLLKHSRRTLRTIKQNISFALGLKLVFIVLALLDMASLWMAIAADMGASLIVTFNGLRLLGGCNRQA